MKVTVERTSQTSVSLDIVADQDEFRRAMDRAYRRISQQVFIPGFRPGKAPRPLVERRIGREVIVEEAHREIMDDLYRRAIQQEEIVPVSQPEVDVYQDEPLGFRVAVQVYPEVDLGDYRSVRVEPREVTVSDEEIDEALKDLQERNGVWVEPKEPRRPQDGDQVIIDLEVKEDDQPLQEPIKGAEFVLGRSALFTEIEEAIKQLLPGATAEFDITFAEDDQRVSPEMRGKTLHYTVTLQEVKERELPPIDDELAKTVGEESLDALKQAIRRDLLRNRALEARTEVVNEIIDKIAERLNLEIPSAMVDRQVEDDLEQLRQRLLRQGSNLDEYLRFTGKSLDELKEEMRPTAEEKIRNALILEAFSKAEEIAVTDEELEAEIDRLVAPAENQDEMRQIYGSPYFRSMIADDLASRKVSDRLIDIATEGRGAVVGEGAQALEELEAAPAAAPVEAEERVAETQEAEAAAEAAEARPSEQVDVEPAEGEEAAASEQAAAVVAGEQEREREQPSEESEEAPEA